jgi:hypothetical protein
MESSEHPKHDHERTDVQAPVLGWLALVLAVFLILVMPLLVGVFKFLKWDVERDEPVRSPLAITEEPPAPRLQAVPALELGEYRAQQHQLLGEYRWLDQEQKIVRIPIERASQLLLERGLPKVPPLPVAGAKEQGGQPGETKSNSVPEPGSEFKP